MVMAVTGDTHGEHGRFLDMNSAMARNLSWDDILFVCGDFGYVFWDDYRERTFRRFLAEDIPYKICFVDGNHENFDILDSFAVEMWCGGKVHVIKRDKNNEPKVIHLMRGQVFTINGKKIFTFGGAYSIDKSMRTQGYSWWPQEMPSDEEKKEAIDNLKLHNNKVDYILTHTAPEYTISAMCPAHPKERPLNNFLQWIADEIEYEHWWFGHMHVEQEFKNSGQTAIYWELHNMENNNLIV